MIVGLGNPGAQYAHTPHNAGFDVLDNLAERQGIAWRRSFRFQARVGRTGSGPDSLYLVQPLTYMNRSGTAVAGILRYHRMSPADLMVVSDDADLELGRLRIRAKGSSGGHRGLQSIVETLGTDDFARLRVGVGRPRNKQNLVDYVLRPLDGEEAEIMQQVISTATRAVDEWMERGVDAAMNRYNGWTAQAGPESKEEK